MIRDNGPGMLFCPVKMMKDVKGSPEVGKCMPLNKAALLNKASDASVKAGTAVTVLTYLHGVREAQKAIEVLKEEGLEIDLLEMRSLKPLDKDAIRETLALLDAPVKRLSMDDAPVPYSLAMEAAVVKRDTDLVQASRTLFSASTKPRACRARGQRAFCGPTLAEFCCLQQAVHSRLCRWCTAGAW